MPYEHQYSKSGVDAAIRQARRRARISNREERMIHAILKGRQKSDEPIHEGSEQ
jgi:hypothetical protein